MLDFEARALIGWLVQSIIVSQLIRTRASKTNIFVFALRLSIFSDPNIEKEEKLCVPGTSEEERSWMSNSRITR